MKQNIDTIAEIGRMLDFNFECAKMCYEMEGKVTDPMYKLKLHKLAQMHIKEYLSLTKKIQP